MAMVNEHLLGTAENDQEVAIELVNFKDFQISAGGSGHVSPGIYEGVVTSFGVVKKKDKQGKNVRVEMRLTAPGKFAGVSIVENIPAPVGEPGKGDDTFDTGNRKLSEMYASIHSGLGSLEEKRKNEKVKINGKWAKEKKVYVVLGDEEDKKGVVRSKVSRYAYKEEFDATPGPFGGGEIGSTSGGRAQREAPEVTGEGKSAREGNGATPPQSKAGQAALDDALGIG